MYYSEFARGETPRFDFFVVVCLTEDAGNRVYPIRHFQYLGILFFVILTVVETQI